MGLCVSTPSTYESRHGGNNSSDSEVAQPTHSRSNVSSNRNNSRETLSERVQAFRVQREDRAYSMSIEASRLRKIRKAVES